MIRSSALFVALLALSAFASAQQQKTKRPKPKPVHVEVICEKAGRLVTRRGTGGKQKQRAAHAFVARRIHWRIGARKFDESAKLEKHLTAMLAKGKVGTSVPAVVIEWADDVRWQDVVNTFDLAASANARSIRFGTWQKYDYLLPKAIAHPLTHGGRLIVPTATFVEPDDHPLKSRPTLDVLQDGRVLLGDSELFDPKKKDPALLKATLLQLRNKAAKQGLLKEAARGLVDGHRKPKKPGVDLPILVRADKWTPMGHVRRVIEACHDPDVQFWKIEIGVAEDNPEAKLLRKRR